MSATNEQDAQEKTAEALLEHIAGGGTLGEAINLEAEQLEAIYAVAYNHFTAKKYDKAIDLFKFLCLYDHAEPRWYYSLGVAQQQKGDHEAAVTAYGMATLLDVEDPRPQAQAGYCLMALGRYDEARSALEGAIMACGKNAAHANVRSQAEVLLSSANMKK